MKNVLKITVILFLMLIACQNKKTAPKVKEVKLSAAKIEEITPLIKDVDKIFKAEITAVYTAYNSLKDALVASDSVLAKTSSNSVLSQLDKVEMSLLKQPESHKVWMAEKPLLKAQLTKLVKSETLAQQRTAFLQISNSMIRLVENFGVSQKVMVQFCPMADDFKGGYWLSTDAAIKNPYYGSKMLTCGSTKRVIK